MFNLVKEKKLVKKLVLSCYIFLFATFFLVLPTGASAQTAYGQFQAAAFSYQEILISEPLYNEHLELIAGINNSLIVTYTLTGGVLNSSDIFLTGVPIFTRLDFVVSNQSHFGEVWTNPLFSYPDGINVKMVIPSKDRTAISGAIQTIIKELKTHYSVELTITNVLLRRDSTEVMLTGSSISNLIIDKLFQVIFSPYLQPDSICKTLHNFLSSSIISGFGFSITKRPDGKIDLIRKALVGIKAVIEKNMGISYFSWRDTFGTFLSPISDAIYSHVSFVFPFLVKVINVEPLPDNNGAKLSGLFEWLTKYNAIVIRKNFDIKISYLLIDNLTLNFPRVTVSNSYSDSLLNENGTLLVEYKVHNSGTAPAFNTTITFPIPDSLYNLVTSHNTIYVLRNNISVDNNFISDIKLHISFLSINLYIPLLQIKSWYRNDTISSLARWLNQTSIMINEIAKIETSHGLPLDLYEEINNRVMPYVGEYDLKELYFNPELRQIFFAKLTLNLTLSIAAAYNSTFRAFYKSKDIFVFNSTDFSIEKTFLGNMLIAKIPYLDVNQTMTLKWSLGNIPTAADKLGIYLIQTATDNSGNEYIIFDTKPTDYHLLMKLLLALTNDSGRFLSTCDNNTGTFVSLGSRFVYYDEKGRDYYGLTNGINFQFEDDEAVIEGMLDLDRTHYTIGDHIALHLCIINHGSISAYNVTVSILSIQLNSLWETNSAVLVKTLYIPQIASGQVFNRTIWIKANNYVGLNAYVALVDFISDKGESSEIIENPLTKTPVEWIYAGETRNLVSSTLTFGISFPPKNLLKKERPAVPLPELKISVDYSVNGAQNRLVVKYKIENIGLSAANVSISKVYNETYAYIHNLNATYCYKGMTHSLSIEISGEEIYTKVNFESITLNPGEKIIIVEEYTDLNRTIYVSPLIVSYTSQYLVYHSDFGEGETNNENSESKFSFLESRKGSDFLNIKTEISESAQNNFRLTSYSQLLTFNFIPKNTLQVPTFSNISFYYPLITLSMFTGVVLVLALISRKKH